MLTQIVHLFTQHTMLDETMHLASTLLVHLLDGLVIHWPKIHLIIINKYILVNSEYGFGWHTVQWNLGLIRLSNTTNFTTKVGDLKFLYCGQVGTMNIVKFQCEISQKISQKMFSGYQNFCSSKAQLNILKAATKKVLRTPWKHLLNKEF